MSKPKHPGFLVWNPSGQHPRVRHDSLKSAEREAKRLAAENPGLAFYVLAPIGAAKVEQPEPAFRLIDPRGPVDTADWLDDELPF